MIEAIIRLSIRRRIPVLIFTSVLFLIGIYNSFRLSIDAVPDVTNVQVSVVTASPGLSPLEVEQFITYPVELALNGLPDVQEIRSISRTGVSSVTVIFEDSVNVYFARQLVSERMKIAEADIPPEYGRPEMAPVSTGLGDIYEFTLNSNSHTPEQLRTYMEWEIYRELKSVPGVIEINILGGEARQYQVLLDPKRMMSHNITVAEVLKRLKESNLNVGGGYIQKGNEQMVIRGEGKFNSLDEIENTALKTERDGVPLYLGQVAKVKIGPALRFGVCTRDGKGEVVGATVMMLPGRNSREVVRSVKERMELIISKLPPGMTVETFYDRTEFINKTLGTVFTNLAEGALLVLILLYFLLGSWRGAVLVALAIPVTMAVTSIFMRAFGIVGNLMSLGALDFGLLVDGSIVILESVLTGFVMGKTDLSESLTHKARIHRVQKIISESCAKVGRATVFSVAIIMLVYLPLMTLEGVEGKMFRPMALTIAIALCCAMLYSVTAFPASISLAYKDVHIHESHFWINLERKYSDLLKKAYENKRKVIWSAVLCFSVSMLCAMTLGSEFLPRIDEGELAVDVKRLPSTAINYSRDLNLEIERELKKVPEVLSAVSRMGRGESAAEPVGSDEGEIMVKLVPKSEWKNAETHEEMMEYIKKVILGKVPSSYISISQPIENRVNMLLAGSKADVVIKIYGKDLHELKEIAEKIAEKLKTVPGAADVRVQRVLGLPLLEIRPDRDKIARYGVTVSEILTTTQALRVGSFGGKVFEGMRRFDLVARLDVDVSSLNYVGDVPVMTENGSTVPLDLVADITLEEGPAAIYRESLQRRIFVEANVRGRDMVGFVNEAMEKTREYSRSLKKDISLEWGGQFQNFTRARDRLMLVVPIALIIIFGMLMAAFGDFHYALGVFIVVPLSAMGGIFGLFFRDLPFSIPAGVGFIVASGIAVLNGVVYASVLKHKLAEHINLRPAVILSALESLRPVVTTEVVALVGFIPMAVSSSAGSEVQRPLATVVMGGILASTVFSRFLLPMVMEKLLAAVKEREDPGL